MEETFINAVKQVDPANAALLVAASVVIVVLCRVILYLYDSYKDLVKQWMNKP